MDERYPPISFVTIGAACICEPRTDLALLLLCIQCKQTEVHPILSASSGAERGQAYDEVLRVASFHASERRQISGT
jgi:hypothetical protein